jgi:hypothetical protein
MLRESGTTIGPYRIEDGERRYDHDGPARR